MHICQVASAYKYVSFTASGNLIVTRSGLFRALIVGGGGAGAVPVN